MIVIMSGTIRYTIRPYDTIWMLAQVFNTTVDSIMELNPGIDPQNLQIGQVITLAPGYQYNTSYYPEAWEGNTGSDMGTGMGNETGIGVGTGMGNGTGIGMGTGMGNSTGNGMGTGMNANMGNNAGTGMGTNMGHDMGNGIGAGTGIGNGMGIGTGTDMNNRMNTEMKGSMVMDLNSYLRLLWQQHIEWSWITILATVHNLPEADFIQQRLLRNPLDFAAVLTRFYGEEAARRFSDLLTSHLMIAGKLVQAAMAGDNNSYADLEQSWYENADEIAALLSSLNPYWSVEDWEAMLEEHLNLLAATIKSMVGGNYAEAINGFDELELQALEMAGIMADGIMMQFPD